MRDARSARRRAALFGVGSVAAVSALRICGVPVRPVRVAMAGLSRIAPSSQPRVQKAFWRAVYGLSTRRADGAADAFMNYGYAPMANANGSAPRAPGRDGNAFGTALYDRVVSARDLAGKDVLEVGCGRGGGTVHMFESHAPRSMVGVDLTPEAITYCRDRFARPGLRFARR